MMIWATLFAAMVRPLPDLRSMCDAKSLNEEKVRAGKKTILIRVDAGRRKANKQTPYCA